jgi:hypothetical protein
MLLLTWKYAFSIKPYSPCNLGYISLNVKKDFGATFEKRRREENVRRERERKGQVSY